MSYHKKYASTKPMQAEVQEEKQEVTQEAVHNNNHIYKVLFIVVAALLVLSIGINIYQFSMPEKKTNIEAYCNNCGNRTTVFYNENKDRYEKLCDKCIYISDDNDNTSPINNYSNSSGHFTRNDKLVEEDRRYEEYLKNNDREKLDKEAAEQGKKAAASE
nr:MAG TPA: zinc-ribbon containing domain protein [Caudoviricetes sp.]